MINYEYNGKQYPIKNEAEEITLRQLSKITELLDDKEKPTVVKYLDVIEYLGGKELRAVMTADGLTNFIENFNASRISAEITPEVEVNGVTYSLNVKDGEIQMSATDLSMIETFVKKEKDWAAYIFATLYKDVNMTSNDNKNVGHIKKKAALFMDTVTADIANPVIVKASLLIVDNVDKMRTAIANA